MPRARKTEPADSPAINAASLIETKSGAVTLSKQARAELATILQHNDAANARTRVGRGPTLKLLHAYGWPGGKEALDTLCRVEFGRTSFARP